jgi:hypothetical protein
MTAPPLANLQLVSIKLLIVMKRYLTHYSIGSRA